MKIHGQKTNGETCWRKAPERRRTTVHVDRVTCRECLSEMRKERAAHVCHECDGSTECTSCEGCGEINDETCGACHGDGNCHECNASGLDPEFEPMM